MADGDPFDLKNLRLPDGIVHERRLMPRKIQKRQQHFIKVPWSWFKRLQGANAQTYRVALYLLYLCWKGNGDPIKLSNGMMTLDGVPPQSKRRALRDLERRGLVTVEWRPRKTPLVRLL